MKSDTVLEELAKNSIIREVRRVGMTPELQERIGPELVKEFRAAEKHAAAYRFLYTSQKHAVVGYIVVPKKRDPQAPVIVFNRGGSGDFGMLRVMTLFTGTIAALTQAGYVVIASQYSGVDGSEGVDEMGGSDLHDVLNLHKIIEQTSFLDKKRIGMYGASRGGMMTYLALAKVKWIRAAVTVSALSDLLLNEKFRPEMKAHFKKMFGGAQSAKKDRSAVYWTERFPKSVPILIMAGTSDWRVSPMESVHLFEKLYERGLPVRLIMYEGADHALSENFSESRAEVLAWFDKFVKNKGPLPNMKRHGK